MILGLVLVAFVVFGIGIGIYSRWLERVFEVDDTRLTPAVKESDGIDRVPARWPVLFGHHFASIAGAAPIIGPVLAISLWGWAPVYWWVVLGSTFVGGFHDFGALMMSLRFGGMSVGYIAERLLSRRARLFFSVFLYLALVLVVAVFGSVTAKTFVKGPEIVLPSLGLIPIAVLVGYVLNVRKWNLLVSTLLGLGLLSVLLGLGQYLPISIGEKDALSLWIILLMAYSFLASITPVHLLLQPRDYLSSYLLFFGLIVGYVGVLVSRPTIHLAQYHGRHPLDFWPMLFVIVACGAISGFHSLISSGTTVRQIAKESHARLVAYNAMVAEGALALLSTLAIITGFGSYQELGAVLKSGGPITAFSIGFGKLTAPILGPWGSIFGIIMLNAFVLTTLDTATRIARYVVEELTGIRNRYVASALVVLPALGLALSGHWKAVWPLFGSANQLIAVMVLMLIGVFLSRRAQGRNFALLASGAMSVTILFALYLKSVEYWMNNHLLWGIALALFFLAIYMIGETIARLGRNKISAGR